MNRVKTALALGALLSLGLASNAQAVSTESTWSATATGSSAGGSKSAPAPFSGDWFLTSTNNAGSSFRPASPKVWSWSWEGVTVRQNGFPFCSDSAINDAKTVAVCPAGSRLGLAPGLIAQFGPIGVAEGPNTLCLGKSFELFNGPPGTLVMVADGPPEQCGTLGFLGAYPITLATSGGKTTMTWDIPANLENPFPGAEGAFDAGGLQFNKLTTKVKSAGATASAKKKGKKKKKKTISLLTSVNCKGTRDFNHTVVDTFGTHQITASAGNCKAPKKAKKKKKKK